jgi:hypothetical protein
VGRLEGRRISYCFFLLGTFGGQEEFVFTHSDGPVKIVVDGSAANRILLVTIRDSAEENRSIQRTI